MSQPAAEEGVPGSRKSHLVVRPLTPHQREKLAESWDKERVHVTAPAGAGKTFVALHFMQSVLADKSNTDRDRTPRVVFIARNPPLTITSPDHIKQRCHIIDTTP